MTTPARKPATDAVGDNILIIVGQLLEATKAASDGLKSMSIEVQTNAKAIITAATTLSMVSDQVSQLDKIIRDSTHSGNLLSTTSGHAAAISALHAAVEELRSEVENLQAEVGHLGVGHTQQAAARNVLWDAAVVLGWVFTTAVALYAAFRGK